MSSQRPHSYLIAGFILVVLLMLSLAGLGAQRLEVLKGRVDYILQDQMVKIDLTHRLRSITRERMIRMNLMTITSDPFVRDQNYQEFLVLGNRYIGTRHKLEDLVKGGTETAMLDQLRNMSINATPIQERVVELALDNHLEQARALLFEKSLLIQQEILDHCDVILTTFEQSSQSAMEQARQTYQTTYTLMINLTTLAVLLTAVIGMIVVRRIKADRGQLLSEIAERRKTEQELRHTKEGLEQIISERTATLRENLERLSEAQRISHMGHWEWDIVTNELRWSDEIYRLFGLQPTGFGATHDTFMAAVHPEDRHMVNNSVERALRKEENYQVEHRIIWPDGTVRHMREKGEVAFDENGQALRMIGTVRDITDERENEQRLWHLAHHDALTGLPNRSLLYATLSQALTRAKRSGSKVALMLCDLDHFKSINDRYGHDAGDQLIVEAGRRIKSCIRESDVLARLGGDEFTVVMEDVRDPENTRQVAQKITDALNAPFELSGEHSGMIGVSIGIALYPEDAPDMDGLLKNADVAIQSKRAWPQRLLPVCRSGLNWRMTRWNNIKALLRESTIPRLTT
ncbi:diguanylate cyclase domain-containing protein [Sulfurimicrobium lacus]|nr:diguanylate cyclase [Sulfurimicrobium lacus]